MVSQPRDDVQTFTEHITLGLEVAHAASEQLNDMYIRVYSSRLCDGTYRTI
jgi:hypothetical protein